MQTMLVGSEDRRCHSAGWGSLLCSLRGSCWEESQPSLCTASQGSLQACQIFCASAQPCSSCSIKASVQQLQHSACVALSPDEQLCRQALGTHHWLRHGQGQGQSPPSPTVTCIGPQGSTV